MGGGGGGGTLVAGAAGVDQRARGKSPNNDD